MTQGIIVFALLLAVGFLVFEVRRKRKAHEDAIRNEKSDIATITRMTATMSTFADGRKKEALLAASEDTSLFFYRLIMDGKVVARYTIAIENLEPTDLLINGQPRTLAFVSTHTSPLLRAADISMQARQNMHANDFDALQEISLRVHFKTEGGARKTLPIHICSKLTAQQRDILPKIYENAVWWQQYLSALAAPQETDAPDISSNPNH